MPKVSVVIPVFNAAPYLPACLESVLGQSFRDFELVVFDDGSTDGSAAVCDSFAAVDPRVKVVHSENVGVGRARAEGVRNSTGEWVMFVDADDELPTAAMETLLAASEGCDIVIGTAVDSHGKVMRRYENRMINGVQWVRGMIDSTILPSPWAKIFRRSLLDEHVFDFPREFYMGEDMATNIRIALKCNSIRIIPDVVYIYKTREGNISSNSFTLDYAFYFHAQSCDDILASGAGTCYSDAFLLSLFRKVLESGRLDDIETVRRSLKQMNWWNLRHTRKGLAWYFIFNSSVLMKMYIFAFSIKSRLG